MAAVAQPAAATPDERAFAIPTTQTRQVTALVLVGGASQMPLVQRIAVRLFGKLPYQVTSQHHRGAWRRNSGHCRLRHER